MCASSGSCSTGVELTRRERGGTRARDRARADVGRVDGRAPARDQRATTARDADRAGTCAAAVHRVDRRQRQPPMTGATGERTGDRLPARAADAAGRARQARPDYACSLIDVVVFQYNPDTLTRTIQPRAIGGEPGRPARGAAAHRPAARDDQVRSRDRRHRSARASRSAQPTSRSPRDGLLPALAMLERLITPAGGGAAWRSTHCSTRGCSRSRRRRRR